MVAEDQYQQEVSAHSRPNLMSVGILWYRCHRRKKKRERKKKGHRGTRHLKCPALKQLLPLPSLLPSVTFWIPPHTHTHLQGMHYLEQVSVSSSNRKSSNDKTQISGRPKTRSTVVPDLCSTSVPILMRVKQYTQLPSPPDFHRFPFPKMTPVIMRFGTSLATHKTTDPECQVSVQRNGPCLQGEDERRGFQT